LGPCPSGKTGYTINGATTACVTTPTLCPAGSYGVNGNCHTVVVGNCPGGVGVAVDGGILASCVQTPTLCPSGTYGVNGNCHTIGPCDSGKNGEKIDGSSTTCFTTPTLCPSGSYGVDGNCHTVGVGNCPGGVGVAVDGGILTGCVQTPTLCPSGSYGVNGNCHTVGACTSGQVGEKIDGSSLTCVDVPVAPCDTIQECEDYLCGERHNFLLNGDCQPTLCPGAATECAELVCQSVGWTDDTGNCQPPAPCGLSSSTSDCLNRLCDNPVDQCGAPGCVLVEACTDLLGLLRGGDLFRGICSDPDAVAFYDGATAGSPHGIGEQCEDDSWHEGEPSGPIVAVPGIPGGPEVPDPTGSASDSSDPFTLEVQKVIGMVHPQARTSTSGANGNYDDGECPLSVQNPADLDGDGIENNADPDMDCDGLMDVVEQNILGTSPSSQNTDGVGAMDGFDLAPLDTTINVGVRITDFAVDGGLDPWSYSHDGADPYIDQVYIAAFPGNPVYLPNIPGLNHEDHPHDVGNRNQGDVVNFNPNAAVSSVDVPGIDDVRQWITVGGRPQLTIHLAAFDHDGESRGKDDPIDLSVADSGHAANLVMDLANLADAVSHLRAFTFDGELDGDGGSNDGSVRLELRVEVSSCQLKASTAILNDPTALVSESLLSGCRQ
jgi:hypothetical protein